MAMTSRPSMRENPAVPIQEPDWVNTISIDIALTTTAAFQAAIDSIGPGLQNATIIQLTNGYRVGIRELFFKDGQTIKLTSGTGEGTRTPETPSRIFTIESGATLFLENIRLLVNGDPAAFGGADLIAARWCCWVDP